MRIKRRKRVRPPAYVQDLIAIDSRPARVADRKKWEDLYLFHCQALNLPPVAREHRFALEQGRKWRFDFAFMDPYRVAVEIEGLVIHGSGSAARFGMGRHNSVQGFIDDMEKYNAATVMGWSLLRFHQKAVQSGEAINVTCECLRRRGWINGGSAMSVALGRPAGAAPLPPEVRVPSRSCRP